MQDASHELRTPITSLRTNIDVLSRHPDLDPAARAAVVAELRLELGELSTLLSELVATAGDAGDVDGARPVSLDAVVRRAVERVGRRHDRVITVIGSGAVVEAPPTGLARAVTNLLENAVKFSPAGSPVEARLADGRLAVHDQGPGIAPADAERVFDRFYRSVSARSLPGSGLGLAIVRHVVEGAGGRVFVQPAPAAAVGFELPVARPADPAPPPTPVGTGPAPG